jgi:segregation and condensation protein A
MMQTDSDVQLAFSIPSFDGPFDLLLSLIRKNQYPIDNLPLVEITAEFLTYIREAKELDIDLGGEFLDTASWLVLLKSRSLLRREAATEAQDEFSKAIQKYELDREELDKAKNKLESLRQKRARVPASAAAQGRRMIEVGEDMPPSSSDVVKRIRSAIASARAAASFSLTDSLIFINVEEQRTWVLEQLARFPAHTALSTYPWFAAQGAEGSRASLLLALLELARSGDLLLNQCRECGPINIKMVEKSRARYQND